MNFVPWENLDFLEECSYLKESGDTKTKESFKIRRVKSDAAYKFKRNQIQLKRSRSYNQRCLMNATVL